MGCKPESMNNNQLNSRSTPDKETAAGNATAQTESSSHFKRNLVPLNEYAARQGISTDIIEQQGQLGVIQIRKFKGQKFVVDVPAEQLSDAGTTYQRKGGIRPHTESNRGTKNRYGKIQGDLSKTKRNLNAIQSELTTIQEQMSLSKVEIESIQNSLNENKNQLDTLYKQNSAAGSQ